MKEIKLTLTVEETNQILDALGNQPFKTVSGIISKIQAKTLNVTGKTTMGEFETAKIKTDSIEVGSKTKISNDKIEIDGVSIGKKELEILHKLANNQLTVRIRSTANNALLSNHKKRSDDGDAMRSIQFTTKAEHRSERMKLEII